MGTSGSYRFDCEFNADSVFLLLASEGPGGDIGELVTCAAKRFSLFASLPSAIFSLRMNSNNFL